MYLLISLITLAAFNTPVANAEPPACGDEEKATQVYKAFELCNSIRASKETDRIQSLLKDLGQQGYCSTHADTRDANVVLASVCSDPVGYVCKQNQGNLLNSQCQFLINDKKEVAKTPGWVEIKCAYQAQETKILQAHRAECPSEQSEADCVASLKLKYKEELLKIERNLAYTPARIARLKSLYERVIEKYVALVSTSTVIPAGHKELLIKRIKSTDFSLDPNSQRYPSCMNADPTGPSPRISNRNRGNGSSVIIFCIGALAMLDQSNVADLLETIGHEVAHSIDPCRLETEAFNQADAQNPSIPIPSAGLATYPGLLQCLRGGEGDDGCKNPIIHCNSPKGIETYCNQYGNKERCLLQVRSMPSCPWGMTDHSFDPTNPANYQKNAEPIDQTKETFCDFMGAEVTGAILQDDAAKGKRSDADRIDALVAISADFAQIHGQCLLENTNDPHATGYLRVGRAMMGSGLFREALCYKGAPPPKGIGTTCKMF